jgi:hypothetical protein
MSLNIEDRLGDEVPVPTDDTEVAPESSGEAEKTQR